jgi:hypothetical protein
MNYIVTRMIQAEKIAELESKIEKLKHSNYLKDCHLLSIKSMISEENNNSTILAEIVKAINR